jgi:hypothetical protein
MSPGLADRSAGDAPRDRWRLEVEVIPDGDDDEDEDEEEIEGRPNVSLPVLASPPACCVPSFSLLAVRRC